MTVNQNNKRIAFFLATSGHSGVDRIMGNLIREFAARGIEVDLLRVDNHGPYLDPAPDGVRVVRLGSRHVYSSLWPLLRYMRGHQPMALLCDKHKVNLTALWARALARSPTRVIVRTGTTVSVNLAERSPVSRWLHRWSVRRFYSRTQGFVMPSNGAADDMARFSGLARDRITVIPNPIIGVGLERESAKPVDYPWLQPTRDQPVILGVGELGGRKDFSTLLRAFAGLRARRPCRLIILGRGGQRERLLALARELGVAAAFHLPGFVANPYAWMARADLLASSSRWEGLPTVLVEALGLGLPVVATDCPSGPREILQNGCLGELVPVGDASALQAAMERTLEAPLLADKLRAGAQRYTVAAGADAYLKLLRGDT